MRATILLVDDEYDISATLRMLLEMQGYRVVTAADGEEALAGIEEVDPDVLVTDLMMPGMDGEELCRRVRAKVRFKDLPIILMSAASEPDGRDRCDWDVFLQKPFDLEEFLETIGRLGSTPNGVGRPPGAPLEEDRP